MAKQNKRLLLQDICARLPYGVEASNGHGTLKLSPRTDVIYIVNNGHLPYLRPMSSMTEEEKHQLMSYAIIGDGQIAGVDFVDWVERKNIPSYIDWLNKNHFDYRGLIEKGLAIEAPEGMYYSTEK